MASSVFYKFKSQRDESRVSFDGTGISVFDLKREILVANNLTKGNDFDIVVYDRATDHEFKDDSQIIPRSSSVTVKRLPPSRPGKGKAAMYLSGVTPGGHTAEPVSKGGPSGATWHKGSMSKRFDGKEESPHSKPSTVSAPVVVKPPGGGTNDDEAAAMAAMFQAQTANWEETQEKMTHAVRIYNNNPRGSGTSRGGKPHTPHHHHQPERPLPASYVCYRCGQKGHWIQDCPTNSDREFDNKPRIKRTTGIPRSMLKTVESPAGSQFGQGVMVTQEGTYVVAQPDSASWQKQVARAKVATAADIRDRTPTDPTLACPIDNKLFRDAVKTPCCGTIYCEDCIQTHLLERDFICPNCAKKIASLDKLVVDKPARTKVTDYIERAIEESKKEAEETNFDGAGKDGQIVQDNLEQDIYSDQQNGSTMDFSQMLVDSIPQLQAQIAQISVMLQNPSLPNQVRQTTEHQHVQLQMQLQQAQAMSAVIAVTTSFQQQQQQAMQMQNNNMQFNNNNNNNNNNMQNYQNQNYQQGWANQYQDQQSTVQDSAYQRQAVNRRRGNLKRERPSDFLEVGLEKDKMPRYWE